MLISINHLNLSAHKIWTCAELAFIRKIGHVTTVALDSLDDRRTVVNENIYMKLCESVVSSYIY